MPKIIFRGQFTSEPNTDPLAVSSPIFANRDGQGEAMGCSHHSYNPDHNATAFVRHHDTNRS